MKKTNSTNKLAFGKATIVELNDNQLHHVNGGTITDMPSTGCVCKWIIRTVQDVVIN